jgi:hypothetical protein
MTMERNLFVPMRGIKRRLVAGKNAPYVAEVARLQAPELWPRMAMMALPRVPSVAEVVRLQP